MKKVLLVVLVLVIAAFPVNSWVKKEAQMREGFLTSFALSDKAPNRVKVQDRITCVLTQDRRELRLLEYTLGRIESYLKSDYLRSKQETFDESFGDAYNWHQQDGCSHGYFKPWPTRGMPYSQLPGEKRRVLDAIEAGHEQLANDEHFAEWWKGYLTYK